MALIVTGNLPAGATSPFWVVVLCAIAISAGTFSGGWRIIRTLGRGLVEIESPQGMSAESSSAAIILLSSHFGYSLSTTHVVTGSILGTGMGKKGAQVRWNVAGRMAAAWLMTLPAAGIVGAIAYWIADLIGGDLGIVVVHGAADPHGRRDLPAVTADRRQSPQRQRRMGGRHGPATPTREPETVAS